MGPTQGDGVLLGEEPERRERRNYSREALTGSSSRGYVNNGIWGTTRQQGSDGPKGGEGTWTICNASRRVVRLAGLSRTRKLGARGTKHWQGPFADPCAKRTGTQKGGFIQYTPTKRTILD